ncbi:MAG: MG2 domain-containing protein [Bacteroidales bacterium]|nr:MG2 domain-containing protein [Bacteroidales bacterium]
MMKLIRIAAFLFTFFCFCYCDNNETRLNPLPSFNDYVESFTVGDISRYSSIQLTLTRFIPEEMQNNEEICKCFSIKPKVKGKIDIYDGKKIIFTPSEPLQRDSKYTVEVKIDKLFKDASKKDNFKFSFSTVAPKASVEIVDFSSSKTDKSDINYIITANLRLSDVEDSSVVHELIGSKGIGNLAWDKTKRSKKFSFRYNVTNPEKTGKGSIFIKSNNEKYKEEELISFPVFSKDEFTVFSIESINEEDEYIKLSFSRQLLANQDFDAFIKTNIPSQPKYQVEGNKLKIWINRDNNVNGSNNTSKKEIIEVKSGIKDAEGNTLDISKVSNKSDFIKEINYHGKYPELAFVGEGGIIPYGGDYIVPFTATSLRGIIVRVIKIYQNNMGQFLQQNNLNGNDQIARIGELLCRKVIFLDEMGHYDITKKNTFAIDLKDYIEVEPGALYRVILSYNYDLSAYPGDNKRKPTNKEILEENAILEKDEIEQFGLNSSYYYFNDQGWKDYNWKERNNPTSSSYYVNKFISKNILSTNLAITAKNGDQNNLLVFVNNLITAKPEKDVEIEVYDAKNQLIEKKKSWDNGSAEFFCRNKVPYYIIASKDEEKGYLRMDPNESLSLSTFDVSGDVVKKGVKGFIYAERGIWRPGDTIFVSFILNDRDNILPANHPITFELYNPLGQLYSRKTISKNINNFYTFPTSTSEESPTGIWIGKVVVGNNVFEKKFRVETIRPNRLNVLLKFNLNILTRDSISKAELLSSWLTGNKASNLKYEITGTFISQKTSFKGYERYVFDDPARIFNAEDVLFGKGETDNDGNASVEKVFKLGVNAPGMLKAQFLTRVFEQSGQFSINSNQMLYSPYNSYVGIFSPQEGNIPLLTNKQHTFNLVNVNESGKPTPNKTIFIKLYKVEWYWWWNSNNDNIANYISSGYNRPFKQFTITTDNNGMYHYNVNIGNGEWGTYFVEAEDVESGHKAGILAYFDTEEGNGNMLKGADKAMMLNFKTEKTDYLIGEKVKASFPSSVGSRAIVTVANGGRIVDYFEVDCRDGKTDIEFEAKAEMIPNSYLTISLINPYKSTKNDLPIRMYGTTSVNIADPSSHLYPEIKVPKEIKPNSEFKIEVSSKNNEPFTFTLAVVDEGLLDLTKYPTPNPYDYFYAKEASTMRMWDMYNYVLGAYGGKIEQLFSIGGDDALMKGPKAVVNRFKPVTLFKGPIQLAKGEKKIISMKMPNYVGKVRCMVIAGNTLGYGCAQQDILVKQSIMILGSMPASLSPGDIIELPITVFSLENKSKAVNVDISSSEIFDVIGDKAKTITFNDEGNKVVYFKIKVKEQLGNGNIKVKAVSDHNIAYWEEDIPIISQLQPVLQSKFYSVKPGESLSLDFKGIGMDGTNNATLQLSTLEKLNIQKRIDYLIDYPYSCLEQIVSSVYPYLFLKEITDYSPDKLKEIDAKVNSVIKLLNNYQIKGSGEFSYWPGSTSGNAWGTIYAVNFLLQAKRMGFLVPSALLDNAVEYISRVAKNWNGIEGSPNYESEQTTQAYRLLVLSQVGNGGEKSAMARLRQEKNLNLSSRLFLCMTYIMVNRMDYAHSLYENFYEGGNTFNERSYHNTFGEPLRDKSLRLFILTSFDQQKNGRLLAKEISQELSSDNYYNTQSLSFALSALGYYYEKVGKPSKLEFEIKTGSGFENIECEKSVWETPVEINDGKGNAEIINKSKSELYITSVIKGIPAKDEQIETANTISIKNSFYDTDNKPININSLTQGVTFTMETVVENNSPLTVNNIMISQKIPSGWNILNDRFVFNNDSVNNSVNYQNIRDLMVESYVSSLKPNGKIVIPIKVTTSYPGIFYLPSSTAEDMYNFNISASTKSEQVVVKKEKE